MKKKFSLFKIVIIGLLVGLLAISFTCRREIRIALRKQRAHYRLSRALSKRQVALPCSAAQSFPPNIQKLPKEESVIDVKKITIRNVPGPCYNASLSKCQDHYLLFFRYDVKEADFLRTYIGSAELDAHFDQTEKEFQTIQTHSDYSEDARIVTIADKIYLLYNDKISEKPLKRTMHIGGLNLESYSLDFISSLDLQVKPIEKNWAPFECVNEKNENQLYFEYYIYPRQILQFSQSNLEEFNLQPPSYGHERSELQNWAFQTPSNPKLYWPHIWGRIRGGTPVQKVGDQFLGFFHSNFRGPGEALWYVMGAYTFETQPPFRLTGISACPILFNGIYDSPNLPRPGIHCIYPCGYVVENRGDREVIHVSCGENDIAIKIVTFDKNLLLKQLLKLPLK